MAEKKTSTDIYWIGGLLLLTGLLFLSRGLIWLLPTVIIPVSLCLIIVYFWRNWSKNRTEKDEIIKDLRFLLNNCEGELEKVEQKSGRIKDSQKELRQKLRQEFPALEPTLLKETKLLLEKYQEQADLLAAKREFYQEMHDRISGLMANHEWKLQLAAKRRELENLQDEHYEAVDKMENMRQEVAYSTGFISAIKELSQEISESSSTLDIQQLKQELEKLIPNK